MFGRWFDPRDPKDAYRMSVLLPQLAAQDKESLQFDYRKAWTPERLAHGLGHVLPSVATTLPAAAAAGGAVAATGGGAAAVGLAGMAGAFPAILASSVNQAERGAVERQGFRETEQRGQLMAGAIVAAVFESAWNVVPQLSAGRVFRALGRGRPKVASKLARDALNRTSAGRQALRGLRRLGTHNAAEFISEGGGELTRQAAAASATGTEIGEGWDEATNEAFLAGLVGLPISTVSVSVEAAGDVRAARRQQEAQRVANLLIEELQDEMGRAGDVDAEFDPHRALALHRMIEDLDAQTQRAGGIMGSNDRGAYIDLGKADSVEERLDTIQSKRRRRQMRQALRARDAVDQREFEGRVGRVRQFEPLSETGVGLQEQEAGRDQDFQREVAGVRSRRLRSAMEAAQRRGEGAFEAHQAAQREQEALFAERFELAEEQRRLQELPAQEQAFEEAFQEAVRARNAARAAAFSPRTAPGDGCRAACRGTACPATSESPAADGDAGGPD